MKYMSRITSLRMGNGRGERVNVYLDGKFAFSLEAEVVAKEGLKVDQEITPPRIEMLTREDNYRCCLSTAVRYISYRPRSQFEVREKLTRHGFDSDCIEVAIRCLIEQGLVDDVEFARFWKGDRQLFSPRSKWLTGLELRRKGIAQEVIEQVMGDVSDEDNAYRAALSRISRLPASDYRSFRHRLAGYLSRRGFNYRVINNTVEQLWREVNDHPG
jgi:regulatory protein